MAEIQKLFKAVISIWVAIFLGFLFMSCSGNGEVNSTSMVSDVFRATNAARDNGATCEPYPAVKRFAERRSYESPGVQLDDRLIESAQNWADYMAETDDYRHQELSAIGDAGGQSENIAYIGPITTFSSDGTESTTPEPENVVGERLVRAWLNSPGHCHNLMQPQWGRIGIGVALSSGGRHYGVQVFGR